MTAAPPSGPPGPAPSGRTLAFAFALLTILVHLAVNLTTPYGFQRDEFLYFGMGQHLRLWRMDFPPFVAIVANATRWLLGESIPAMRLPSALAGGAIVYLAMDVARHLGGRTYSQVLAALCVLSSTLFLRAGNLFQPVVFDQLWWTLGLFTLIRLQQTGDRRWWLALGAVGGIGLLTKFSIFFFGFSVLVALLLTPERRLLATRWPWLTLLVSLALGSPSIVGQVRLGFPVVGQLNDLQAVQLARITPLDFTLGQFFLSGPAFFLAAAAVATLLVAGRCAHLRIVGWTAVAAFGTLLLLHGKHYYLGPVYPALFGVGAVFVEHAWGGGRRLALRTACLALLVAWGAYLLPVGLPFLPPERMEAYTRATGLHAAVNRTNTGDTLRLPQDYADMLGWEERVAAVAGVFRTVDLPRRARAVIVAGNWGEAGALDFYGPRYGLRGAISPSGSYWFFGPGNLPGDVAVAIGLREETLRRFYRRVTPAARITNEWTVPEERDLTIYICEEPSNTLQQVWPSLGGRN